MGCLRYLPASLWFIALPALGGIVPPFPRVRYDRAVTVFAPDGSLLQVEYAQAVAAKGAPAVAVVAAGGRSVVLATVAEENDNEDENNGDSNPQDDDTSPSWDEDQIHSEASVMRTASEKLLQLDDHVWVAVSGLRADGRVLVDRARQACQEYRLSYGEAPTVRYAAASLASLQHATTMKGGARPSGVTCLVVGVDLMGCSSPSNGNEGKRSGSRCRIFRTDPSGSCLEFPNGCAIGQGADAAALVLAAAVREEGEEGERGDADVNAGGGKSGATSAANEDTLQDATEANGGREGKRSAVRDLAAAEALAAKALRGALNSRPSARQQGLDGDKGGVDASEASADEKKGSAEEEIKAEEREEGSSSMAKDGSSNRDGLADAMKAAAAPASVTGSRAHYHHRGALRSRPQFVALRLEASQPPSWPSRGPRHRFNRASGSSSGESVGALWNLQAPHCAASIAPIVDHAVDKKRP